MMDVICCVQSWMPWETSSWWMTTAPTWMRLQQLRPSQRVCLEKSQPTGYFTVLGVFSLVYRAFFTDRSSFCVSGWCSGGRVWPSSDSCYIKEWSELCPWFYMYHSLSFLFIQLTLPALENQSIFYPTNDGNFKIFHQRLWLLFYEWGNGIYKYISEVIVRIGILLTLYSFCSIEFVRTK